MVNVEIKAFDQAWSDMVKVSKFVLSCFGVAFFVSALGYNLGLPVGIFPKFDGPNPKIEA